MDCAWPVRMVAQLAGCATALHGAPTVIVVRYFQVCWHPTRAAMPRATLVHNTTAGETRPTGGELREIVERQGYSVTYSTTNADLDDLLEEPGDMVVVAGGDGTVGQVAARLIGRPIPLAILPIGTANNLAESIGVSGPVDRLAAGWAGAHRRLLDLARARGPWGVRPFIESFGLGLFPHVMPILSALRKHADRPPGRDAALRHDRAALRKLAQEFAPRVARLTLDDAAAHGEYLMVEVMNAPMLGPRLRLAPGADPGDGLLDVVLVREPDRRRLADWLGGDPALDPGLEVRRARTLELLWDGDPLHIDGETWAGESRAFRSVGTVNRARGAPVTVTMETEKVTVLVPRRADERVAI
jgi:diacylglycerol kinase (ATP)